MSAFDDDFAAADAMFAESFGDLVEIHRGVVSTADVTAEATIREYEVRDSDGFPETIQVWDWILDASDYVLSGTTEEPQRNDRIKKTINGEVNVFRVLPIGGDKPCFEYADPEKNQLLIHSKLVGTE